MKSWRDRSSSANINTVFHQCLIWLVKYLNAICTLKFSSVRGRVLELCVTVSLTSAFIFSSILSVGLHKINALGLKWCSHLVLAGGSPGPGWQIVLSIPRWISHVKGRVFRIVRPAKLMITFILVGKIKAYYHKFITLLIYLSGNPPLWQWSYCLFCCFHGSVG